MEEQQAISRLKRGEIASLAVLVEHHQLKALRVAMLITRDEKTAEDVVQNAFIKAYQRIGQFDEHRPFAPWFLKSVVNASLHAISKEKRSVSLESPRFGELDFLEYLRSSDIPIDEQLQADEIQLYIKQALDKLPPEQRAVVVMRYYLDMSESEIAAIMHKPHGTIKWRLHSARNNLRGLLKRTSYANEKEVRYE